MTAQTSIGSESSVNVRFSRLFAVVIILLSHAPLVFALQQIISLKREIFQEWNFLVPAIALLVGLLIIAAGMSQPKRWYLRLDRDQKMLLVSYGIGSWSKKHPYDSICFDGEKLYIERNEVKRRIGFLKLACNRKDLKLLALALEKVS